MKAHIIARWLVKPKKADGEGPKWGQMLEHNYPTLLMGKILANDDLVSPCPLKLTNMAKLTVTKTWSDPLTPGRATLTVYGNPFNVL